MVQIELRFVSRVVVSVLLVVGLLGCKRTGGAGTPDAQASPPPSTSAASAPPPIPEEPPPADADRAKELPALEAKLKNDKAYASVWTVGREGNRRLLLTAVADLVAFGTMHLTTIEATKKVGLFETATTLGKILSRSGKLPDDFVTKAKTHFASVKGEPHLGLWSPAENGQPAIDATALAMWFSPNDGDYVRERLRALAGGPFPYRGKEHTATRPWLANIGDVAVRLNALGKFGKEDCLAVHMEWSEQVLADGRTVVGCDTPKEPTVEAKTAPAATEAPSGVSTMRIKSEGAWVGATTKAKLEKAVDIAASGDRAAFEKYVQTEPGVAIMAPRTEVVIVELDGILLGPARVRRKGGTQEVWVLREALE